MAPDAVLAGRTSPALIAAIRDWGAQAKRHLDEAESAVVALPALTQSAFRALSLAGPYLRLIGRADYEPFRTRLDLPQWRRQWALWRGFA